MNYMGGKWRQGPAIARLVEMHHLQGMPYYEPFCGALGSACRAVPIVDARSGASFLSDISAPVVNMWRAVLGGWDPPTVVSEEMYNYHKRTRDPSDPMTAFCGFGISFGGKWFGGYARNALGTDYVGNARKSILTKADMIRKCDVDLQCTDYRETVPHRGGAVVYFDPPYTGRVKAHDFGVFDHTAFWDHARALVRKGTVVLVTEFIAPDDWVTVHSWGDTVVRHQMSRGADGTDERIFMHRDQAVLDLL